MIDDFFERHELSIWIFVTGISVIMLPIFGGGLICPLVIGLLQQLLGKFTAEEFGVLLVSLELIMSLFIAIPNILIIRGRSGAVKINKIIINIQLTCYIVVAILLEHEYKWFFIMFVFFPLLASWLMSTARYQAFVAYHEALHKDPVGFRQRLLDRMHQ
ncbi:hypothetical protein [Photobacterium nomapromontoriensis]|uniref:hypothetical protein n=1 Tax=Photobacterium nomapromontoriensis TaxID=2910237 RepID=UPI003D12E132